MLEAYPQDAVDELLADVTPRLGWDFSRMNVVRQPVPWDYTDLVVRYLRPSDNVLDLGTGGGELFASSPCLSATGWASIKTPGSGWHRRTRRPAICVSACAANGWRQYQTHSM